jgi:hypothetical protein
MEHGRMKVHSVYDSGPDSGADRYTVYYKGRGTLTWVRGKRFRSCVGMSASPFHPQGIGQHGMGLPGKHNGKRIKFEELPEDCRRLVVRDLNS